MASRDTSTGGVAGGLARHIPVLAREVLEWLEPAAGGVYVDGTFGAGGYARLVLEAADCRVVGIDRDPGAIAGAASLASEFRGRLDICEGRFSQMAEIVAGLGLPGVRGVMLDLGVSSMQLDEAERGFSFMRDGPLDMRMSQSGPTAADVVNTAEEDDLARIVKVLGEEKKSRRVAQAIVRRRGERPFTRTGDLAEVVAAAVGPSREKINPATRTFQALRLHVNQELQEVAEGLLVAERILEPGGRIVVVSFHSLEDRIVKRFLASRSGKVGGSRHLPAAVGPAPTFELLTRQAVMPGEGEIEANPRARSARLRAARRTEAPAIDGLPDDISLPRLPEVPAYRSGRE
nr:16S rRNA (cytosine(1402)-N(4))-methyltransferase RsmH [Lutibaculum baratangense]